MGAWYDCTGKGGWFNLNCALSVAGAALGIVGLAAKAASALVKLPALLARHNMQAFADVLVAAIGGAKKLGQFMTGAHRLLKLSEGWKFQALTAGLIAIDEFLAYLDAFQRMGESSNGSPPSPGGMGTVPSAGVAC